MQALPLTQFATWAPYKYGKKNTDKATKKEMMSAMTSPKQWALGLYVGFGFGTVGKIAI